MPVYKIYDKLTDITVMVEAARPNAAIAALTADRFSASEGLTAGDALRLATQGVKFITVGDEAEVDAGEDRVAETRMPLSAFGSVAEPRTVNDIEVSESSPDSNLEAASTATHEEPADDLPSLSAITAADPEDSAETSSDWQVPSFGGDEEGEE